MKRKLLVAAAGIAGGFLLFAGPAGADGHDGEAAAQVVQAVMDNLWVFIAGVLVFLMQAGFAMLESGLPRPPRPERHRRGEGGRRTREKLETSAKWISREGP